MLSIISRDNAFVDLNEYTTLPWKQTPKLRQLPPQQRHSFRLLRRKKFSIGMITLREIIRKASRSVNKIWFDELKPLNWSRYHGSEWNFLKTMIHRHGSRSTECFRVDLCNFLVKGHLQSFPDATRNFSKPLLKLWSTDPITVSSLRSLNPNRKTLQKASLKHSCMGGVTAEIIKSTKLSPTLLDCLFELKNVLI